jgi:hypothetical protein
MTPCLMTAPIAPGRSQLVNRAPDSVVPQDAVATQDTVTQLIAAVRRVIREVWAGR